YVLPENIEYPADFASIDVSFISLGKVLGPVRALLKDEARLVCLIKPQFEAGREKVGKHGVVREKAVHEEVIAKVLGFAEENDFGFLGLDYSPIRGPEGNIEYLLYIKAGREEALPEPDIAAVVEAAHGELDA
ncbi:MAG: SAM-dependent methyltransferase, partial [bacterium]